MLHQANPLAIVYIMTIRVRAGALALSLTLTVIGQQLRNMTPCSDNPALLI